MVPVAIARSEPIDRAIHEALDALDLQGLIRGKFVAVKPNETTATRESKTGVTQPDTLRAVLEHLQRLGPRRLLVSGGSGAGETDEILEVARLMQVIRDLGIELIDHNRGPFVGVDLEYRPSEDVAGPQTSVMVNPQVLGYEVLVSLAQIKLHRTATVTLALKNIAMSYPAADYYGHPRSKQDHQNWFFSDMHSFIAAMAKRFPIGLAINVGHPAMVATGPLGGHAVETGLVVASTDPLAADVVGAALLGFSPQAVRHLWEAARLGVGESETKRMEFPLLSLKEATEAFTEAVYGERLSFEAA